MGRSRPWCWARYRRRSLIDHRLPFWWRANPASRESCSQSTDLQGATDAEDVLRTWSIFDDLAMRVVSVDSASPTWTEGIAFESHAVDASAGDPATSQEFAQQGAARLTAAGRDVDSVDENRRACGRDHPGGRAMERGSRRPGLKRTIGPRSAASRERGQARSARIPRLGLDRTRTDRIECRQRVVALSRRARLARHRVFARRVLSRAPDGGAYPRLHLFTDRSRG